VRASGVGLCAWWGAHHHTTDDYENKPPGVQIEPELGAVLAWEYKRRVLRRKRLRELDRYGRQHGSRWMIPSPLAPNTLVPAPLGPLTAQPQRAF